MNNIDVNSIKIGVVGAGSWGTTLADLLGEKGFKVDHWVFEAEVRKQIHIMDTTLTTALPRQACATASIQLRSGSYPKKTLRKRVTENI